MTNEQIRASRLAHAFRPKLWAFAYPLDGRGWYPLRRIALSLWAYGLRLAVRRQGVQ